MDLFIRKITKIDLEKENEKSTLVLDKNIKKKKIKKDKKVDV